MNKYIKNCGYATIIQIILLLISHCINFETAVVTGISMIIIGILELADEQKPDLH